ncbi:MAG: cytochrome C oxidase subunit IV family protein [Armatimonadota bacterium]|nr:cytochrome C oxidase subunit IV family protein [Armatimonadota bacterium]MDR7468315.1 cytochrome C oxidase subunit IV family protein [Armatimonadota bacterium]MDR7492618.1 cytochrome C oxidase subunit IV family protein [Armatimonadota bacterium]MDR7547454.1 cytochrome C oxidase subunit IV family protein [Armatimonadota bacterium]MDR7558853.1 cytochrome C oxidase subunit IV family protein [Armatimonadota bacterium]
MSETHANGNGDAVAVTAAPARLAGRAEQAHGAGYRIYAVTWFWLLAITVVELAIVLLHVPKVVLATALLIMALLKAALIVAYFMHLRYEKLSFVYAVIVPMVFLAVVLWSGTFPDALNVFRLRP